jgi:fumarate hydratase class II
MGEYRNESDVLGEVKVPSSAYYGSETQRAVDNFPISGLRINSTFIKYYAIMKRAAAITNVSHGRLDKRIGGAIVDACDEIIEGKLSDQFVVDAFQAGAGTSTNMNLNEVIANRAIELLKGRRGDYKLVHPNDHVNMAQSTNDTYHANIHITAYAMLTLSLLPTLKRLETAFSKKSKEFSKMVKIGRTHLQDAVPMTLGQEFSGYAYALSVQADNIRSNSDYLLDLSLGGTAVGTGIESYPGYSKDVVAEISKITGFKVRVAKNFFGVQQNQVEELAVSGSIRGLASLLVKIANDLRLLSSGPRAGFSDITLPPVQPGSSIMPGKINPSMPEMLDMVCFEVIGKDTSIAFAAQSGQLELNVFMPVIAYNLLYSISILDNAISVFTKRCVVGIKADKANLNRHLNENLSLATALSAKLGYAKAAQIARRAYKEGKTVKQVCIEMKVLKKPELDKMLDSRKLIAP